MKGVKMKLKDHKDFPNVTNLKRVGHANKHYINGLKAMRDRCGEIEVFEGLDVKEVANCLVEYTIPRVASGEDVSYLDQAKAICQKFGIPKIDERKGK